MLAFHILFPERLLTFWASGTFCPPTSEGTGCHFFPSGKQGQPLPAGEEEGEAVVLVSWTLARGSSWVPSSVGVHRPSKSGGPRSSVVSPLWASGGADEAGG